MLKVYVPSAHFWRSPDGVWCSARRAYVKDDDTTYAAWVAAGNAPTPAASADDIRSALTSAGYPDRAPGYVPPVIDMWQARAALRASGRLTAANAAATAVGGAVRDAWEYGNVVRRDAPVIAAMGAALGMSPDDLDNLFRVAAKLSV